jgi:hypothetical protein
MSGIALLEIQLIEIGFLTQILLDGVFLPGALGISLAPTSPKHSRITMRFLSSPERIS